MTSESEASRSASAIRWTLPICPAPVVRSGFLSSHPAISSPNLPITSTPSAFHSPRRSLPIQSPRSMEKPNGPFPTLTLVAGSPVSGGSVATGGSVPSAFVTGLATGPALGAGVGVAKGVDAGALGVGASALMGRARSIPNTMPMRRNTSPMRRFTICSLREVAGPLLGRYPLAVRIDELDVQVRPRGVAGVAAVPDQLALFHGAVRDL